ncbi:MAG: C25 family cysteine peptidase, partial [Sulfolobales archaeon]
GYGIVNFAGHGNTRLWDFGEGGVFWDLDVYQLTNGFNTPIVATMACLTNDFADTDVAISEAFMIHPDGGAIAYLGVAEVAYGYGGYYVTEGLAGAIDWVFLALFKALEDEGYVPTPGLMHAYTIIVYLNAFGRSWVLDWYTVVEYGTLLGDPMLPLTGTGSPPPPPPTPRLYGCALDKDGHVVTNVLIRLYDYMSGNLLHEGIEADGCYEFVGLPYGTYMIEASKDDFYGGVAFYYPHVVMEKNVVLQEFPPNTVLLVVDDDGQGYVDEGVWPSEIESVLTSMGFNVFVWRESENGRPPLEVLQHENVEAVVWHTGTYFRWAVDPVDAQTLIQFVESGGRLLLEGEDIGWNHDRDEFMRRVAHAYQLIDDTNEETMVATAKHPVVYSLPTFSFETMPPYPDGVEPVNNGEEVARYQGTPYSAVVVYDGLYWGFGGRVVYVAFPLHYLYESYRNTLVENAVEWLTTSYVLKVSTDRGVYLPGYTVKAVASLFDGTNPLPGITVTASIYYPDGTVVSGLTMYDDGTHGDDVAGDGNYTLLYDILDTYPVGYYQIEAEADIPGYVPIYRNATFRVVAAPGFSLFVEDRDIVQGIISVNITVSNDAGLNIVMVQYRIDGSDWVDIPAPIDGAYDEDVETVHIEIDGYSHSLGWHFLDVRAFAEGGFESWWLGRPFEIRELSRRYNLISLIYYPEPGYSASSLARAIGPEATLIASWDTTAQKFKGYVPGVSPPSDDFPMEMGFGYFVYLTSPRRLVEFPGW